MNERNCPNCGAPVTGRACPYCGTRFENPENALSLAVGKTVSVSFEHDGMLYEFDMAIDEVNVNANAESVDFYNDFGIARSVLLSPTYDASFHGRMVPSVKHGHECMLFYRELDPSEILG